MSNDQNKLVHKNSMSPLDSGSNQRITPWETPGQDWIVATNSFKLLMYGRGPLFHPKRK